MARIEGKVALITGAGSGLGRATALRLAEEGARVAVTDWNDNGGRETVDQVAARGGEALFFHHDVSKEESWSAVLADLLDRWGRLDILVNNAAVVVPKSILETSLEDWRWQNSVDLDGVFLGVKLGIVAMERTGGGSIVNISSVAGIVAMENVAGYCAAKAGVRLLSKCAALECARRKNNVRVNSIHPGVMNTAGVETTIRKAGSAGPAMRRGMEKMALLGRLGDPVDIANGVLYLASDESKFCTGSELVIDGGLTAV